MAQNAKSNAKGKKSTVKATSHHASHQPSGAKNLKDKDKKTAHAASSSKSDTTAKGKKSAPTPVTDKKTAATAKSGAKVEATKGVSKKAEKETAKAKESKKGKFCNEPGCTLPQMNDHFCRLHYIKNWNTIISSRRAQARANLNKYIESLSEKYPDEYMEKIRDDIGNNEGAFHARLRELGFREEYESSGGGDNPFQMENFDEFVHGLKFEE